MTKFSMYLLGRTFILMMDHCSLVNILFLDKLVPVMAAAQVLTLSAYSYIINYCKGSLHANADVCSWLTLNTKQANSPNIADTILMIKQLNDSPVTIIIRLLRKLRNSPTYASLNHILLKVFLDLKMNCKLRKISSKETQGYTFLTILEIM